MKISIIILIALTILSVSQIAFAQNVDYVGSYGTSDIPEDISVLGDYAYIADGTSLLTLNVSDPSNPIWMSSYQTDGGIHGLFVRGNLCYLAGYSFIIMNVLYPANPWVEGVRVGFWATDVYVTGNYAYVTGWDSGLRILDISDAAHPTVIGSYTTCCPFAVFVAGNYAYINAQPGLLILDISNPANPILCGRDDPPGASNNFFVLNNFIYIAAGSEGLQILDISDPTSPTLVSQFDTPDYARDVYISGNYAYVADNGSGLQVVDISDIYNPMLAGSHDTPYAASAVFVFNDYIYVGDTDSIFIFRFNPTRVNDDYTIPNEFSHSQNYPNPFNASTSISYSLSKSGPVNLSIYNLLGQKVATLSNGIQQAGNHQVIWNAGDFTSGVYFARLVAGRQATNIKMILLK